MSARLAILLPATVALAACATAQENPNYKFSSKYGAPDNTVGASPVQAASYETSTPILQSAPAPQTATSDIYIAETALPGGYPAPAQSETEAAFDASTMSGTPGYEIMMAETEEPSPGYDTPTAPLAGQPLQDVSPSTVNGRPQGARPVAYDYSQNVIIADAPTVPVYSETRTLSYGGTLPAQSYSVAPGDTVYSIARRLCVPIAEVTAANGIGADYAIKIGQPMSLPASRC